MKRGVSFFPRFLTAACFGIVCIASMLFSSCGSGGIGMGVVLWSTDEKDLDTGSVTRIIAESNIRKTYTVKTKSNVQKEVPQYRIAFFKSKREVDAFQKNYEPYRYLFATANQAGLPIREKGDRLSQRVYRLRPNQLIKILDRDPVKSDEAGMQGYWYKVLTDDGVSGYCFDFYLTIFDMREKGGTAAQKEKTEATVIEAFFEKEWRPAVFKDMLAKGPIDLRVFSAAFGLFADAKEQLLIISLPAHTVKFTYESINDLGNGRYAFKNTPVLITFNSRDELSVQYTYEEKEYSALFVAMDMDIDAVVAKEKERRGKLLTDILFKGTVLSSSAYGTIALKSDFSFEWTGFQRLVPVAIPRTAQGTGTVDFQIVLGESLKSAYAGVISFHFAGTKEGMYSHFLYSFKDNGLNLVYAPESDIKDRTVVQESYSPLIIYFAFVKK